MSIVNNCAWILDVEVLEVSMDLGNSDHSWGNWGNWSNWSNRSDTGNWCNWGYWGYW